MTENKDQKSNELFNYVLILADSDLIRGQRLGELCSKGPELEIDIALTNIALDFIGQARLYYQYASELSESQTDEDQLAYFRDERAFRNNLLVERPLPNFAHTIVSQYLLDVFRKLYLNSLSESPDTKLAGIAAKGLKENAYHLKFSGDWLLRLGGGTEISRAKTQEAIDQLWPYVSDLFSLTPAENKMEKAGICGELSLMRKKWELSVKETLEIAGLAIPSDGLSYTGGKQGIHGECLGYILAELQYLQRAYPGLEW